MSDWRRKVRPGEALRISANAYNAFVDASSIVLGSGGTFAGAGGASRSDRVLGRNTGTAALERWRGAYVNTFEGNTDAAESGRIVLGMEVPFSAARNSQRGMWGVALQSLAVGEVGWFQFSGISVAEATFTGDTHVGKAASWGNDGLLHIDNCGQVRILAHIDDIGSGSDVGVYVVRLDEPSIRTFTAKITDAPYQYEDNSDLIPRWKYEWEEVAWAGSNWTTVSGGRSHTTDIEAHNRLEATATPISYMGIELVEGELRLPGTGLTVQPVPVDTIVEMRSELSFGPPSSGGDETPYQVVSFSCANPILGDCEAPSG